MRIVPSCSIVVVAPLRVACGKLAVLHEPTFRKLADVVVTAEGAVATNVNPGLPALNSRKSANIAVPVASVLAVSVPASVTVSVVHGLVPRDEVTP